MTDMQRLLNELEELREENRQLSNQNAVLMKLEELRKENEQLARCNIALNNENATLKRAVAELQRAITNSGSRKNEPQSPDGKKVNVAGQKARGQIIKFRPRSKD